MRILLAAFLLFPSTLLAENFTATWDQVASDILGNTIVVTSYNVYSSPTPGVKGLKIGTATTNLFKFTENKPGTYYATVTAVAGSMESFPSSETTYIVAPKAPASPKTFKIVVEGTITAVP